MPSFFDIDPFVVDDKYILVRLVKQGDDGGETQLGIVAKALHYHSMVEQAFLSSQAGRQFARVEVLGGGILALDRDAKTLRTYGKSGGFGAPPADLLREAFANAPDPWSQWSHDIQITDYIRD